MEGAALWSKGLPSAAVLQNGQGASVKHWHLAVRLLVKTGNIWQGISAGASTYILLRIYSYTEENHSKALQSNERKDMLTKNIVIAQTVFRTYGYCNKKIITAQSVLRTKYILTKPIVREQS